MVLMYVRFPLSLGNVEDLVFERGIDICHSKPKASIQLVGPAGFPCCRDGRGSTVAGTPRGSVRC